MSFQTLRDNAEYALGYAQGRQYHLTDTASRLYAFAIARMSSLISLPLPLLSFLALPFFGSTTTSINLLFFYLTWTGLVWSYPPLQVEMIGTVSVRLLFFLLPALAFLGLDVFLPSLAASCKAHGDKQLPTRLGQRQLTSVVAWSIFNFALGLALQAAIEVILTEVLHMRSALRISTAVTLPWTMLKELLQAFAIRGLLHYFIHRFVLHASPRSSPIARWHKSWAHSLKTPFSLAAAYDHPVCYLLAQWLPVYLPAVLFSRLHVLTYVMFLALTSLENLLIYSGYDVLPSRIILPGMARRVDAHYATGGTGGFGHWGVMDWVCGTGCPGEADVMEDLHDEAEKRDVRGKVDNAVDSAGGMAKENLGHGDKNSDKHDNDDEDYQPAEPEDEQQVDQEEPQREESPESPKRRNRRRPKKA